MTKIITPYYPIQHLLREFSKALGTKSLAAKKIDDACKNNEISSYFLEELKQELIHQPLTMSVSLEFADLIMDEFNYLVKFYLKLMKNIELEGVDEKKAQRHIAKCFMTFSISHICKKTIEGFDARALACSDLTMMSYTLDGMNTIDEWKTYLNQATKEQKDRIRSWGQAKDFPKFETITQLSPKDNDAFSGWNVIKVNLIISRLWDYTFYRSELSAERLNYMKIMPTEVCLRFFIDGLKALQLEGRNKYSITKTIAAPLLTQLLRLRAPKQDDAKHESNRLLIEMDEMLCSLSAGDDIRYFYHWMTARYHLHSGALEKAVNNYEIAFEMAIYRAGENTEIIIREALVVACRLSKPPRSFINRLRRMAVILGVDYMPPDVGRNDKKKPSDIEHWEISAFSRYFDTYVPKSSFFKDAEYPVDPYRNMETLINNFSGEQYALDLKKPNKFFELATMRGMKLKMPQIVYFSLQDQYEEIEALVNVGANVNELSSSNDSALLLAINSLTLDLDNLFKANRMDDNIFNLLSSLPHRQSVMNSITTKKKMSLLGQAVATGRLDIVKKIVEMGASIDLRHGVENMTPLFTAISYIEKFTNPQKILANIDARKFSETNIQARRAFSNSIMPHDKNHLMQVMNNPTQMALEDMGQQLYLTKLKKASSADNFREIAKYLIEQGADFNAKHDSAMQGYTPLMLAIESNEDTIVEVMMNSRHHKVKWDDTCVDTIRQCRVNLKDIAQNWKADKVSPYLE
ncbi:ankyrin repeat domain-containing protein [Vibrio sp. Vf1514]|uniref:ankyrin repeat domain-containing protein n=1 Tax=Vibrio sp. Vf1514 TaxID=3437381 RepID=UPI003F89A44C